MACEVFISYAHKDRKFLDELATHLSNLRNQGVISDWHDGDILPGTEWKPQIMDHLQTAQIILLLISADFMASKFCYSIELQEAIARHDADQARVIPILLRPTDWEGAPFAKLQMLPSDAKPVNAWSSRDAAFKNVVTGIRRAIQNLNASTDSPPNHNYDFLKHASTMQRTIEFTIQPGDVTLVEADVVALKYAQDFYGADMIVASSLSKVGIPIDNIRPQIDDYRYIDTKNGIKPHYALFVGVVDIFDFDYQHIRQFSAQVLRILANEAPHTHHLIMTIHGPGYGLDEIGAFNAQLAGYLDALQSGQLPFALEQITIIEIDPQRVQRLRQACEKSLDDTNYATRTKNRWSYRLTLQQSNDKFNKNSSTTSTFEKVEIKSAEKAHVFVAMPFMKEMDDVFYYGIQQPVHAAGFLCERVDQDTFTGDILDRVKKKIETAVLVIAELSGANPNVYLEVGYAWGKGRPTILLVKNEQELRFDVRGQRCLKYERIKDLEDILHKELRQI